SFSAIAVTLVQKMQEATLDVLKSIDESISSFKRATGASKEYEDRIVSVYEENRRYGVTVQDATQAMQDLYKEVDAFRTLTDAQQKELAGYAALLENVGVDAKIAGQSMQIMTSSFQ